MEQLMDIDNQDNSKPKRRRSVRGRRSSLAVISDAASPTVIPTPLSESIGDTTQDQVTKLRARRDEIRVYITRLQEEKEKWDQMMENYKHRCQKAIDLADQLIEPPASRKAPLSELMETEAIQSPRYILNRVLKAFHNRNKSTETKKIIDDMEVEANLVLEVLSKKKRDIRTLTEFLNCEPLEELEKQKKVWESIKECEERRAINLKAKFEKKEKDQKCNFSRVRERDALLILKNEVEPQLIGPIPT